MTRHDAETLLVQCSSALVEVEAERSVLSERLKALDRREERINELRASAVEALDAQHPRRLAQEAVARFRRVAGEAPRLRLVAVNDVAPVGS